jgi:hypothetical protein
VRLLVSVERLGRSRTAAEPEKIIFESPAVAELTALWRETSSDSSERAESERKPLAMISDSNGGLRRALPTVWTNIRKFYEG